MLCSQHVSEFSSFSFCKFRCVLFPHLNSKNRFICVFDSHPQEMIIAGLQPETAYSITVAAYTMKGDGARSKPKLVVTKGAGE